MGKLSTVMALGFCLLQTQAARANQLCTERFQMVSEVARKAGELSNKVNQTGVSLLVDAQNQAFENSVAFDQLMLTTGLKGLVSSRKESQVLSFLQAVQFYNLQQTLVQASNDQYVLLEEYREAQVAPIQETMEILQQAVESLRSCIQKN